MKKYLFCSISFGEYGDEYHYISDIDIVKTGDFVIVHAGKDNKERVGSVEKVQYYSRWTVPCPINKAKKIIICLVVFIKCLSRISRYDFGTLQF